MPNYQHLTAVDREKYNFHNLSFDIDKNMLL